MKKSLLGLVAIGALISAPAMAADMPLKAPPAPVAPEFSWTGFYIGAQGGGGWGAASAAETAFLTPLPGAVVTPVNPPIGITSIHPSGGFGGVTVGYNYQFASHLVLGVEGDWSAASITASTACSPVFEAAVFGAGFTGTCGDSLRDFATATARLGWAWDRALFYLKGGAAWARYNETATSVSGAGVPGPAANFNSDRTGYTIGVGLEYAFTQNWSVKVEYDHLDFGTSSVAYPFVNTPPFIPGIFTAFANDTQRVDIVRAGANYRFNWGGPIAARD